MDSVNNNTTEAASGNTSWSTSSADPSVVVVDYVGYVFVPVLFVLGLIGNSLTIRVMASKAYRQLPVSKLLIALSFSDILVNLLIPFNRPFLRQLLGTDLRALSTAGCKLYFWAYRFSRLTSSWMVVLISCERFVAVWLHMKARYINTTRTAYIAIGLVYAGFVIYVGYVCSWSDRVVDGVCIINSRPPGLEDRTRIFLAVGLILYSVLPSVILILLTTLILFKLFRINRKKGNQVAPEGQGGQQQKGAAADRKSVRTSRTNVMLLSVVIVFIVLITPNAIAHLVAFIKRSNMFEATDPASRFLQESSQIMEQLNHSINFLLYVFSSKRFRDGIVVIFRPRMQRSEPSSSVTMNMVTNVQDT